MIIYNIKNHWVKKLPLQNNNLKRWPFYFVCNRIWPFYFLIYWEWPIHFFNNRRWPFYFLLCRFRIIPRLLRDVSNVDTSTTVLGHPVSFPVCIAPTACHRRAHDIGEIGTARGRLQIILEWIQVIDIKKSRNDLFEIIFASSLLVSFDHIILYNCLS